MSLSKIITEIPSQAEIIKHVNTPIFAGIFMGIAGMITANFLLVKIGRTEIVASKGLIGKIVSFLGYGSLGAFATFIIPNNFKFIGSYLMLMPFIIRKYYAFELRFGK